MMGYTGTTCPHTSQVNEVTLDKHSNLMRLVYMLSNTTPKLLNNRGIHTDLEEH